MNDALKTRGIKYSHVETWLLFAPPIKIFGFVPERYNGLFGKASPCL